MRLLRPGRDRDAFLWRGEQPLDPRHRLILRYAVDNNAEATFVAYTFRYRNFR
jgi:hypothetical protein